MTAQAFPDPGGDVERAQLAPTAHAVRVARDLVLLDLEADDYLLIPDCPDVEICGGQVRGPMAVLLDLSASELLRSGAPEPPRPAPPPLPWKGLPEAPPGPPSWRDVATFGLIWADAARRRPTLQVLAKRFSPRHGGRDDLVALSARVAVFRQMLPFAPSVGACLFQAELLLRFLNAGGLDADWVFGVRTFPFLAHCWLQVGDHCVSQSPETLTIYRPIMAL